MSGKTNTEFTFDKDGKMRFGTQLKAGEKRFRCVKILLHDDDDERMPHVRADEMAELLTASGKTPSEAVSQFLGLVMAAGMEDIRRCLALDKDSELGVQFILTVPAIWSDSAKEATMMAGRNAGMEDLRMVSEPEAAAAFALTATEDLGLRTGDIWTLCDLGAGTGDLITYEIMSLAPLTLREIVEGQGALCGGAHVDRALVELFKKLFGPEEFEMISKTTPHTFEKALSDFREHVKPNYDPTTGNSDDTEFLLTMPSILNHERAGVKIGQLELSNEQLFALFEPEILKILGLIESQVAQARQVSGMVPRGVILVGGFSQSRYLYKRIQTHFANSPLVGQPNVTKEQSFKVIMSRDALTAVVKGAALLGVWGHSLVASRRARYHYGVCVDEIFDEKEHNPESRYTDDMDECDRAADQMRYFLEKGDEVKANESVCNVTLEFACKADEMPEDITVTLYATEQMPAPKEWSPAIGRLCEVVINVADLPKNAWKPFGHKKQFTKLTYGVGISLESGVTYFNCVVGKFKTRVEANFNQLVSEVADVDDSRTLVGV
ncbi:hypothetical protein C1H76_2615 [Elsinoe australis]|uniref:Uncharacterized protein n=1 Tax=Elsinoe australis TaxID=40998 RepID=A0A4U7B1U9_9PEZI|nr:hypothetical protein C1H76_2615 [Elsinoe australis]